MPLSSLHSIQSLVDPDDLAPRENLAPQGKKKTTTRRRRRRRRVESIAESSKSRGGADAVAEADDDFTFPTPPPLLAAAACSYGHHRHSNRVSPSPSPSSSPLPAWLLSSPIRRSFSAADCAASPWRATRGRCCSPALSDYAAGFCDGGDEEEEMMDSLWEDLNDDDAPGGEKNDLLIASLDVSRRRSVGGPGHPVDRKRPTATTTKERGGAAVLAGSRSSRRRSPGLVVMMRALKKMFVAHKSRSKVHKVDEQSTASASSGNSFKK